MSIKKYANELGYTDVKPYEVIKVISDKTVVIRRMDAELDPSWKPDWIVGGFSSICTNQSKQKWIITSSDKWIPIRIRKSKHGQDIWINQGQRFHMSDEPVNFYDYNF